MTRSGREQGSALVLALLVVFILSLLGTSFLMMAQTESRIARNELLATQARYVAEAGVVAVNRWFDRPGTAVGFPAEDEIEFGDREILDPTDPYGATLGGSPEYKKDIDLDGDGERDFLRKPYRGSDEDAFMGTAAGPDMVIDDQDSDSRDFLIALTDTLVAALPAAGGNLQARVSRIDIYAPPYVESNGQWTRMGVATVRVTGRIYRGSGGDIVAEQTISAVLNEIPFGTPIFGPLHTCGELTVHDELPVHWGAITAKGPITYPDDTPESVPRAVPSGPRINRWWTADAPTMGYYANDAPGTWPGDVGCAGEAVEDPWLRTIGQSWVRDTDPSDDPYPEPDPLDWQWQPLPYDEGGCTNRSNIVAGHALVSCPEYDYDFWKRVARSGSAGVHYYAHDSGGMFKEDGIGPSKGFRELTEDVVGLHFFDTEDSLAPRDDDGDGVTDNLTGQIVLVGDWNPRGFIYLNSERLVISGLTAGPVTSMQPPGEPWIDVDGDGDYTPGTDAWVNLRYPSDLATLPLIDPTDPLGLPPAWDSIGPSIDEEVNLHGILFNTGAMQLTGPAGRVYGGLIARGDVQIDGGTFDPQEGVYWDDSIGRDWPPPELGLPLVAITRWDSLP